MIKATGHRPREIAATARSRSARVRYSSPRCVPTTTDAPFNGDAFKDQSNHSTPTGGGRNHQTSAAGSASSIPLQGNDALLASDAHTPPQDNNLDGGGVNEDLGDALSRAEGVAWAPEEEEVEGAQLGKKHTGVAKVTDEDGSCPSSYSRLK